MVPINLTLDQLTHHIIKFELILRVRDAMHQGTRETEVDVALWTLTCVSCVFLSLRLYCKSYKHKDMWWDDWVLILSWVRDTK